MEGEITVTLDGEAHRMLPGGYAWLPPGSRWTVINSGTKPTSFHLIRKQFEVVEGLDIPQAFFRNEQDIVPLSMPGTAGAGRRRASSTRWTCAMTCTSTS